MSEPLGVGVVGCGSIAWIYLENLNRFDRVRTVACSDVILERAQ